MPSTCGNPLSKACSKLYEKGVGAPMESNIWVMAFTGSDVRFVVHALIPTIKLGYIAIALYNAVNAMFSLQPGFFESNTRFVLHGRQIGTMAIVKASLGDVAEYALNGNNTTNSTTVVPNTDLSFLNATVIKNGRNNEYHNSLILGSSAIDHEDHRLKVEFEYQTNVPRSDLWTAALDGMVTAMQFDGAARCDHISAVSISGNLVFHINELPNHMLTCGVAVKTFRLMALISMGYKEYKELEMSIFYDGTKVGEGYVLKIGRAGLVSGGQAATSES